MFTPAINGSYPRFPDPPRPQLLAMAIDDYREGRINRREYDRAVERAIVDAVGEMVVAGVEVVADGQIGWMDPIVDICSRLKGFEVDSGDNGRAVGSHFSKPVSTGRVDWRGPIVTATYCFLAERTPVEVRPVLIGPFSLSLLADPGVYGGDIELFQHDLARALNRELLDLSNAGARYILIEEPMLTIRKDLAELFFQSARVLCRDIPAHVIIGTEGGDLVGLEDALVAAPFAGIVFDLVTGAANEEILSVDGYWRDKIIQLGVVDNVADHIETAMEVALELVKYAGHNDSGRIWVSPVGDFRSLSRATVFEKLYNMCQGVKWARREIARRERPGAPN